jgi:hypothetical protein
LVCNEKKSPSAVHIPFIYLGRYSEFMICKKSHLADEEDYASLKAKLNTAWEQIERNGSDEPNSAFRDSQGEGESPITVPSNTTCCGYHTMDETGVCGDECSIPLFFDLDSPKFFCRPIHLLRYFCLHYGKQGKNYAENHHRGENEVKKSKKGKKNKKGQSKNKESTGD